MNICVFKVSFRYGFVCLGTHRLLLITLFRPLLSFLSRSFHSELFLNFIQIAEIGFPLSWFWGWARTWGWLSGTAIVYARAETSGLLILRRLVLVLSADLPQFLQFRVTIFGFEVSTGLVKVRKKGLGWLSILIEIQISSFSLLASFLVWLGWFYKNRVFLLFTRLFLLVRQGIYDFSLVADLFHQIRDFIWKPV